MKINRRKSLLLATVTLLAAVSIPVFGASDTNGTESNTDAAAANDTTATTAEVKPHVTKTPVKATQLVAENDSYQLYTDGKEGQVRVVSKKTGQEWFSAPPVDSTMPPNNLKFVESPFTIEYTSGKSVETTYPSKAKAVITMAQIDNGVRFDYDMAELGLSLALEYTLTADGFNVNIPFDSVKENGKVRLSSLEVLPFIEAGEPGTDGAIFVPDGSGALMDFKPIRPNTFDSYSEYVYGGDYAFQSNIVDKVVKIKDEMIAKPPSEQIALPVFGTYSKNKKGLLGIITSGDADAKINATPAGIRNINLYRAGVKFLYRNSDIIFVGNSGDIPLIQRGLIPGNRTIAFKLLENEEADYVGLAKAYRGYLTEELGLKPSNSDGSVLNLTLFGGGIEDKIIGSKFIKMTTFEQAKSIVDDLLAQGITKLELTYDGWNDGGKYGDQPDHFPGESALGGNKELKKLAAYLKEKGIKLYLRANYVKESTTSDGVSKSKDVIRGLNNEAMKVYKPWYDNNQMSNEAFYMMKPQRVFDKHVSKEADDFADVGVGGVLLEYMGSTLYSDQQPNPPFLRNETIGVWQKSLDLMKQTTGGSAVEYGFAYTLGHTDTIQNAPIDSSHYVYLDETIPFYQIALHGLVPYSAEPYNLQDDPRVHKLRLLEYGAMPSFEMTYNDSADLKRTPFVWLLSSEWSDWSSKTVATYKEIEGVLGSLANQEIVDHVTVQKNVYRSTYADGTMITVNYNRKAVTIDGQSIDAYGYSVQKGGKG